MKILEKLTAYAYKTMLSSNAVDLNEVETSSSSGYTKRKIVDFAREFKNGISDQDLQKEFPDLSAQERVEIVNSLVRENVLDIYKQYDALLYRIKTTRPSPTMSKIAIKEERLVYEIIGDAGRDGTSLQNICFKTNLPYRQAKVVLKNLKKNELVKSVVAASSNKEVYLLFDIEPSSSVIGSVLYSDPELVDVLREECYSYLEYKSETSNSSAPGPWEHRETSWATSADIVEYIIASDINNADKLTPSDVESILDTLVYDGKAESSTANDGSCKRLFRAVQLLLPATETGPNTLWNLTNFPKMQ